MEELKKKLEQAIESNPTLKEFNKQLLVDITTEGLRVQIVDDQNRPMFELAKSNLQPYTQKILREIGHVLNGVDNRISLSGHTDAAAYPNKDRSYSNWELSADRANASRRELVQGGMNPEKLVKVVGLSSAALLDKSNPLNPINRRISIVIMNKGAEENLMKDNGAVDISSKDNQSKISETVKAK
jgi:chemotaxis protein MotB